jgi:hypothetical protein
MYTLRSAMRADGGSGLTGAGAPYQREAAHVVSMTMPGRTCVMSTRPAPCQNAAGPGGRWR